MPIRILIIDNHAKFRELLGHHITSEWPDAVIAEYDPTAGGRTTGVSTPTDHCGAIVDGQTLARGGDTGLDAAVCLDRADAGTFLAAADALLDSMTTNTNVGDLILGLNRRVTGI